MFKYIKEFFDEYIESWKELLNPESETNKKFDEEIKKENILPVPTPVGIFPIHKSWISHMVKETASFFVVLKKSASSLFSDWLEGWKAIDEFYGDPKKFIEDVQKAHIKHSEKDSTGTGETTKESKWSETYNNHPLTSSVDTKSKLNEQPNQEMGQDVYEPTTKKSLNG